MIESLQMSIDLQMLPYFKTKRFPSELKLVNVTVMVDGIFLNDLKLGMNGFTLRGLLHWISEKDIKLMKNAKIIKKSINWFVNLRLPGDLVLIFVLKKDIELILWISWS